MVFSHFGPGLFCPFPMAKCDQYTEPNHRVKPMAAEHIVLPDPVLIYHSSAMHIDDL